MFIPGSLTRWKVTAELFWAIKGGGGGSWGVVTKVTLRTHTLPEFFGGARGTIKAHSDEAFRKLIARFLGFYKERLFNPHWGEQIVLGPENTMKLSMVCQGLDKQQTEDSWRPFFEWVTAANDFSAPDILAGVAPARHWWDVVYRKSKGNNSLIADARDGAAKHHAWWEGDQDQVGTFIHGYDSSWLPATLLADESQQRLAGALFAASRHKTVELHFNKGIAGAPPEAVAAVKNTATNPVVIDAFSLAIIADGEAAAYPGLARAAVDVEAARKDARAIDLAAAELRNVVQNAGSYVSESNYFNPSWQQAYWGTNYSKLRAIKRRYDPGGLFFVHHGVGSEEWSTDGFTRLTEGKNS